MQRIHFILVLTLAVSLSCSQQDTEVDSENVVIAIRSLSQIIMDGLLNDPVWKNAPKIHLRDSDTGEKITDSTFATWALTCYDENNLYIAFVCNDRDIYSSLTNRDQHLWEQEAVEVFIDVDDEPNTYIEIELSPSNVLFDSYIVDPVDIDVDETSKFDLPGIKTAVVVDGTVNKRDDEDKKWTAEIAIPFADMVKDFNAEILKDAKWKINYYRIDRDADGPVHYAWSPTGGRFHKPSVFGTLIFR